MRNVLSSRSDNVDTPDTPRRTAPQDRARIRRCQDFVWSSPGFSGLIAGAVITTMARAQIPDSSALPLAVAAGHALLGGAGSAFAVLRLYPFERGRAWRAAGAFVFGVVGTCAAALFFGCCTAGILGAL